MKKKRTIEVNCMNVIDYKNWWTTSKFPDEIAGNFNLNLYLKVLTLKSLKSLKKCDIIL